MATLFSSVITFFGDSYIEEKVYRVSPQDLNNLKQKIQVEADTLCQNPELIRRVVQKMQRRSDSCTMRYGGHTE